MNTTSVNVFLQILGNNNLVSLNGLQNVDYIGYLYISGNPVLSTCNVQSICNHLENGGDVSIYNSNAYGCNSTTEVIDACHATPIVQADIFYDFNQNKVQDTGELNYYDVSILIDPGGSSYYTRNDGIFYIEPGSYFAIFDEANNPDWGLTTDSTSYFLSLEENESDTITFGIYPTQQISHIETIINSAPMRCNEQVLLEVTTKNLGTTVADGTVWLFIDDAIPAFNFIHEPDTIIASLNAYGWYFEDLYPGQTIVKNVLVTVPGPPDFEIGETMLFVSFSEFMDVNGEDGSEGFRYTPKSAAPTTPTTNSSIPTATAIMSYLKKTSSIRFVFKIPAMMSPTMSSYAIPWMRILT